MSADDSPSSQHDKQNGLTVHKKKKKTRFCHNFSHFTVKASFNSFDSIFVTK